jgi:hypothetical protein
MRGLGDAARDAGDHDGAERHLVEARSSLEAAGYRLAPIDCVFALGEVAWRRGDLAKAEALFAEAVERYAAAGSGEADVGRLSLYTVWAASGRVREARDGLDALEPAFAGDRRPWMVAPARLIRAACDAALGDWGAFDADVARAAEVVGDATPSAEVVTAASEAAQAAEQRGAADRAAAVRARFAPRRPA